MPKALGGRVLGRCRKLWVVLTALAVMAAALGNYVYRSPQAEGTRNGIVRAASAIAGLFRPRKPVAVVIQEIEQGDEASRAQAIMMLHYELTKPADVAEVFPHVIGAAMSDSEMVRGAAVSVLGVMVQRLGKITSGTKIEESLAALLDEPRPELRVRVAELLRMVAAKSQLDAPPPQLVKCLEDPSDPVRAAAAEALVEYRQGSAVFLPIGLQRLPSETPEVFPAYRRILWNLRFPPSTLPLLIGKLSSDNMLVCVSAATALNHMGLDAQPARPAVMALLRNELEAPHSSLDLRIMDWGDGTAVPVSGISLVVVGNDKKGVLHFRIFGPEGKRVIDADETKFPSQSVPIAAIKKDLETLRPPHSLSLAEKRRVISEVTSTVGRSDLE